ncbi:PA2169 family four-helix-bundle protein [Winogradskyella sp. DF17]|uniref:PA2169 family four-helix-bundle protein n=1 Tax=Winogradskyella pelagia TaxID=2819984 RepID=A0ABS3SYN3_9FLAO|nr:PA2169 family four-helix-bundle protein [Winogradskyella sp. DF17]MBO3115603.1 PA2169 family four-helix-bundle protein [Winogradskyella sp. DF17]
MKYEKIISEKLNELLIKNYDAEKGYINAMKEVDNVNIKNFFKDRAEERARFARQLRTEILTYGELPEDSGSLKGILHRNWMTLKATFSSNNEETILNEALRGEKASLEEYNTLLADTTFPSRLIELLREQRNAIEAAINSVKIYEEVVS